MERYLADLSRPGALTAALNWYRANLRPRPPAPSPPTPPVRAPTLGMWSTGDHYLCEHRMIRSSEFVEGPWRYERIEGASHWNSLDIHVVDEGAGEPVLLLHGFPPATRPTASPATPRRCSARQREARWPEPATPT
jgi:pimeloyl-ACP methyl ester carboxylesterase